jgi:Na+/H+-dicarboxylate symporter
MSVLTEYDIFGLIPFDSIPPLGSLVIAILYGQIILFICVLLPLLATLFKNVTYLELVISYLDI